MRLPQRIVSRHLAALACATMGLTSAQAADLRVTGERYDLRIDLNIAITEEDLLFGVEADTILGVDFSWQNTHPFKEEGFGWFLLWGLGLSAQMQTGSSNGIDATYNGFTGRYYLGGGYEFTESLRLQFVPYIGGGFGSLGYDAANVSDDDAGGQYEWGLQSHLLFTFDRLELGGGVSYAGRRGDHSVRVGGNDTDIDLKQDYLTLNATVGWRF